MHSDKYLIFFDIDGTLVVRGKPVNFRILRNSINQWKKEGVVFGINTSRPWSESARIHKLLHLNGPVIVENGSMYKTGANSKLTKAVPRLIAVRAETGRVLKKFVSANKKTGWTLRVGNDKKILNNKKVLALIFMTNNRKYTASVYVRRKGAINAKLLDEVCSAITGGLRHFSLRKVKIKKTAGGKIIIANTAGGKIATMLKLRDLLYRRHNTLLISDDENVTKNPIKNMAFAAVKNVKSEYKERCWFAVNKSGAEGLKQIIKKFIKEKQHGIGL